VRLQEQIIQPAEPPGLAVRLAQTAAEVRAAQRLRYEVFAEEMGARLGGGADIGLDRDRFDAYCDHLIVRAEPSGEVVGTYRILPPDGRERAGGWYCADEFDVSRLASFADRTIEVGRACVAPTFRCGHPITLLWAGLLRYCIARFIAPRRSAAVCRHLMQRWARTMLRPLRLEVRARGHLPARDTPLLLVANHSSWLDSYALNTVSAARFVAKSEVREWPLVGTIADRFGTFFLQRGSYRAAARMVGALTDALCGGQPVAAFPEGTTSAGDGVLPFYPALFHAAVRSGAAVQPVAIRYRAADGTATRAAAYVGDMSIADSLRLLLREPSLTAELIFCAPLAPAGRNRKQLAAQARAAITAALAGDDAIRPTPLRRAA